MSSNPLVLGSSKSGAGETEKLAAVTSLLGKLSRDLKDSSLQPHERDAALEELKVYGRDPRNADPIFTKNGFETLGGHAFNSPSEATSRNALRCIANAMLLNPNTRQLFVDLGFQPKACGKLGNDSWDDEFLISRVLLLSTYAKDIDLSSLISEHGLADGIVGRLAKHAELATPGAAKSKQDPMEEMALTETARLLFNVTHFCPDKRSSFNTAAPHILNMLWKRPSASTAAKALDPPLGPLVNAIADIDLDGDDADSVLFSDEDPKALTARLVDMLDLSMQQYGDADLEPNVTPLVVTLGRIHALAPKAVRQFMQGRLLPTSEDRKEVLGQSRSLPSRLLKNSTNPLAPELRRAISLLLFDLSDKDAAKFIENVGYGFASGFLFQNDIPIPESALQGTGLSGATAGTSSNAKEVNPVTGQFIDAEKAPPGLPPMTDEEKEREAERLFVLFERLKRTGIVDVQNPVEQAFREGRFEELRDDDGDEEDEKRTSGKK